VELLSEVMDILFSSNIGPTHPDISYMIHILLRDIICSIGTIGDNDPMAVRNSVVQNLNYSHRLRYLKKIFLSG